MYRCFLTKGLILLIWGAPSSDICITSQLILVWSDRVNCFSSFPLPLIPFDKQTKQKSCSSLQISFAVSCCSVFISRNKRYNLSLFCSDSQIRSAANVSSISNLLLSVSAPFSFFFFISLIWSPAATHPSPSLQMYFFNHTPLRWGYIIITISIKEFAR